MLLRQIQCRLFQCRIRLCGVCCIAGGKVHLQPGGFQSLHRGLQRPGVNMAAAAALYAHFLCKGADHRHGLPDFQGQNAVILQQYSAFLCALY